MQQLSEIFIFPIMQDYLPGNTTEEAFFPVLPIGPWQLYASTVRVKLPISFLRQMKFSEGCMLRNIRVYLKRQSIGLVVLLYLKLPIFPLRLR